MSVRSVPTFNRHDISKVNIMMSISSPRSPRRKLWTGLLLGLPAFLLLSPALVAQQTSGASFHQAIRANDLVALRALVAEHGANEKDSIGMTPLMFSAAFGTRDAANLLLKAGADVKAASHAGLTALHVAWRDEGLVRLLITRGADVNAKTQQGLTPLLAAASAVGTVDVVRLLLASGAAIDEADANGLTPLTAAASVGNGAAARVLLARGANPTAYAPGIGVKTATPLMGAANSGDVGLTRLLLARKPPLDVQSSDRDGTTKHGPVLYGEVTALHLATAAASVEVVRLLLDAGARVDPVDVRGTTPLTWAVATDRPEPALVRLLLARGASPSSTSKLGETPRDWARKYQNPAVFDALGLGRVTAPSVVPPAAHAQRSPREVVGRALPLLRVASRGIARESGCVACHAQPMTILASEYAARRDWSSERPTAELTQVRRMMDVSVPGVLQGRDFGDLGYAHLFFATALAASHEPPTLGTDAVVYYLLAKQRLEGHWHGITTRPPSQDGAINKTALAVRVLTSYPIPARQPQIRASVRRAARWLAAQTPVSTEERVMQLLGLAWANEGRSLRAKRTLELIAQQRPDGGWAQAPNLSSDAYATGQVLVTLRELGVASSHQAVRRGVEFLVTTQAGDGSWYVKSRANKIQPYFQSGFPYEHDQWVSEWGTAWAVMGLAVAADEQAAQAPDATGSRN